jgi:uncharacterized protein with PQ loop repeat
MTPSLDTQIIDASSLLSILLVFLFAFFAFLVQQIEVLRSQATPTVSIDKTKFLCRLNSYRLLACGLAAVAALVIALLGPLTWTAATSFPRSGPFPTLQWSLLLVEFLLVVTVLALIAEAVLVTRRIGKG